MGVSSPACPFDGSYGPGLILFSRTIFRLLPYGANLIAPFVLAGVGKVSPTLASKVGSMVGVEA